MRRAAALMTALSLAVTAGLARADAANDNRSLEKGAVEDVTPQQKYQSAIREAGGAYKESLRDCAQVSGIDRPACTREAKATYDGDMAEARDLLRTWSGSERLR
jgi:hypothetical protein